MGSQIPHLARREFLLTGAGLLAFGGCATAPGGQSGSPQVAAASFTKQEVSFANGDIRLAGELYLPDGAGRTPGIVFGHGSGRVARPNQRFAFEAEGLARRGLASLVFDKRGCGQSTGDWRTSDFAALAGDMRAAFNFMREQPGVEADKVGFRGASQAGYVMPIAAAQTPQPSFMVLLAAPMINIGAQIAYESETAIGATDLPVEDKALALALMRQGLEFARTGEGGEAYFARVREVANTPWYQASPTPPEEERWFFDWLRPVYDFDPAPYFREMQMPVLAFYGQNDTLVPTRVARHRLESLYDGSRANLLTVIEYPNAGHDLRYPEAGQRILAPDYLDQMAAWIAAAA